MPPPSQRFYHAGLSADSIRLLEPVTIENNRLVYKIAHFPRAATPSYTAVSYAWDRGPPRHYLVLNRECFHLRRNLRDCLRCLGQHALHRTVPWTHIWVDAICIDQTNDLERAAQVGLMDQIYSNADVVSVWLGLPLLRTPVQWADYLAQLANQPYWSRFWVIQEFLLAQRVQIFFGTYAIDSDRFKDFIDQRIGEREYRKTILDNPQELWAAWPLVAGRSLRRVTLPLHELVLRHGTSHCNDPKDRVFALLGLVHEDERHQLERFFPDYTISHDHVVIIALSHIRLTDPDLYAQKLEKLLLGLGVVSKSRRDKLASRVQDFDYLSDLPPNEPHENEIQSPENDPIDHQAFREQVRQNSLNWREEWSGFSPDSLDEHTVRSRGSNMSAMTGAMTRARRRSRTWDVEAAWPPSPRNESIPDFVSPQRPWNIGVEEVIFTVLYVLAQISVYVLVLRLCPRTTSTPPDVLQTTHMLSSC